MGFSYYLEDCSLLNQKYIIILSLSNICILQTINKYAFIAINIEYYIMLYVIFVNVNDNVILFFFIPHYISYYIAAMALLT